MTIMAADPKSMVCSSHRSLVLLKKDATSALKLDMVLMGHLFQQYPDTQFVAVHETHVQQHATI